MKKIGNVVNITSAVDYVLRNFSKNSVLVIEDDSDVEMVYQTALSLNQIYTADIEILKFDLDKNNQAKTLSSISDKKKYIIITSSDALNVKVPDTESFVEEGIKLKVDDVVDRNHLISELISYGFNKTSFVESNGEFATRGSVIDIFPYGFEYPVRIFFEDNRIYAIKSFDISTQNTFDFKMDVEVKNIYGGEKTLAEIGDFDFYAYECEINIPPEFKFLTSDVVDVNENYHRNIEILDRWDVLKKEIERFSDNDFKIYIYALSERESSKIYQLFDEHGVDLKNLKFFTGYIRDGFYNGKSKIAVFSSNNIFSRKYEYIPQFRKRVRKYFKLNDLQKGDLVVHEDYGIGRYQGVIDFTHRDEYNRVYQDECILIEYAKGDKLYVPLSDFKKIQKYIGSKDKVKITSLDSAYWKNVKEKIKKEVENVAKEILILEAKRKTLKVKPMYYNPLEEDFRLAFPYEETEDQINAINDVLKDLESDMPANRVIVGDVGFGKTEVAMRACFRAIVNGFQVCILCPTTILAEQHYRTFKERFEKFPVNIEVISRLTPSNKQRKIIRDLKTGAVDIIIGTHKLLNDEVEFKNLGLFVIDEEHKFGVKQKEKIKKKYSNVHTIYLSATPIPRTLYQSLSSIRSMSVIETAPLGRLPIDTYVLPYSESMMVDAVNKEISRGGQIYYVFNDVAHIEIKKQKLEKLLPHVKITVIHGQMKSDDIEDRMLAFLNREYDLLLASTIIESGIDIPSVNTLIVEDAHKLGLAQLYQLRGRIGREKQKAYCYLFYPRWYESDNQTVNSDAMKRLRALEEFSELGSGFRLAMRDLEIRGAGELLGVKQHGFINSIGLDMYIRLLNSQVSKLKGKKVSKEEDDVVIDIKLSAYIPQDYISDDYERLNYYRRLLNADLKTLDDLVKDMTDIAGPMPPELLNLINILKLKKILKKWKIKKIIEKKSKLEFYFRKNVPVKIEDIKRWQEIFGEKLKFFRVSEGDGIEIKIDENEDKIEMIKKVFNIKRL